MLGNLQMNDHRITGLTNPPNSDDEATNKKYVDTRISKANIKPSHTAKNVFQYLMDDVNEWSTEYNVKVASFIELAESPHSWDKKVLNITPVKNGRNYRFRLGLQMFRMKTNEQYSLIVELYNRDYTTWERQETFVNGTGMWVENHNTTKYQYHYGNNNTLYYTKTLIRFKKTSSSPPVFVYFTVHYDDKGGDLNTYAKEFKNQIYLVAYGVEGLTDHVDSEVYDAHEAFEIDKTKMKMLVPLDMNGKKIMNTNFDLKFGDLYKIIKCHTTSYSQDRTSFYLTRKSNNQPLSFSIPIFLHSITLHNQHTFHKDTIIDIIRGKLATNYGIKLYNYLLNYKNSPCIDLALSCILNTGFNVIRLSDLNNNRTPFDVDVIIAYM